MQKGYRHKGLLPCVVAVQAPSTRNLVYAAGEKFQVSKSPEDTGEYPSISAVYPRHKAAGS
jgi:hypothetical protein